MIYSFDIFDTCLVRKCGTPANLFYFLARKYYGEDKDYDLYKDFVHNRKEAEKDALNRTKKKSVTIEDIYLSMEETFGYKNASTIMHLEMELETEMLSPVYVIKEQITACRKKAGYVVFISDMYLPKDFLERILVNNGLKEENDKIYISCENDSTKIDGSLFSIVSQDINKGKYSQWIHTGDNEYSDYLIPKKLGIKSIHINHKYSFYENIYIENQFYGPYKEETLLLGSILKAYRLQDKSNYARDFAIDIISSVYIPYVYWVLNDAEKKGINHLLFLARDSEIFYKTAQIFKSRFPNIKLSYIYVSRKSLFLPSLSNKINQEELLTHWNKEIASSPRYLLNKLNTLPEEIIGIENLEIDNPINDISKLKSFIELITNEINITVIQKKISNARQLFLQYLSQNEVTKFEQTAIVDLGWSGSSRHAINKIFKEENYKPTIAYYWGYFGSASLLFNYHNGGELRVFNYLSDNQDAKLPGFVIPMLMEHYFSMTKDGSTYGYKVNDVNMVVPLMGNPDNNLPETVDLHNNTLENIATEINNFPNLLKHLDDIFYIYGRRIWANLISYPLKEDIELLKEISVSEKGTVPLICKLNFFQRLQIALTDNVFGAAPTWKLASMYNSPLREIYHFIYVKCRKSFFSKGINKFLMSLKNKLR